ncbi:MAG: hypothetical protein U9Q88_11150 [Bacillota bacterium]|uniref:hypothetical protein n=1 Tax=Bacillus sp. RO2 TaxID=2723913 RepID=UPI00145CBD74|nr:hypothetical protein [Bacillus sp. RO2]MEA3320577.1 hypothetical protein [Bacillota bacterium]NMH74816.1 hypothetical protein [Bacillus sp. RO2]
MMDYQYRRRAFQNLHVEQEEAKKDLKLKVRKSKSMLASIAAFFSFFHHTS